MSKLDKLVMRFAGMNRFGTEGGVPEAKSFKYWVGDRNVIHAKDPGGDDYQVFASNNDGFELWMGWGSHWKYHLNENEVRSLFWWILWEWYGRARWFGLRRPLYYWALKRHVKNFKRSNNA